MMKLDLNKFIRFAILVEAVNRKIIDEIRAEFQVPNPNGKSINSNIPVTEEEFQQQINKFETMSPDKLAPSPYVKFLAQTAYQAPNSVIRPSWNIKDEEHEMVSLLTQFTEYKNKMSPNGNDRTITSYKTRQHLMEKIAEIKNEVENAAPGNTEEEYAEIAANGAAHKIITLGEWSVWKVPKGNSDQNARSANLLCSNSKHKPALWCVGWEAPREQIRSYLGDGDFFVFQKNTISKWAISSVDDSKEITIWRPSDTKVYDTKTYMGSKSDTGMAGVFKNISAAAEEYNIDAQNLFPVLSSIPEELKALILACKQNPESASTFERVPEELLRELTPEQQSQIFRIVYNLPPVQLIEDLNAGMTSYSDDARGLVEALLAYIVQPHRGKKFTQEDMEHFEISTFFKYLDAHASAHDREMPKEIEKFILAHL